MPGEAGSNGNGTFDARHWLEHALATRPVRWLLDRLTRAAEGEKTPLERAVACYRNPDAPAAERARFWALHRLIDAAAGPKAMATLAGRSVQQAATIRGLVLTARSVARFGLTQPQRFVAPLIVVWNFTNRCNLRCAHCYQDATAGGSDDELTLDEKMALLDQMDRHYLAMVAFAGGEPTMSPDLLPAIARCRQIGMHVSVATNGTTMTRDRAAGLAEAGARYVEVSLDSVHPDKHDRFRGVPGMWARSVEGMRNIVATPGLRLGVAICITQNNVDEAEEMIRFAIDIGAECIAHFNFIPVGRGVGMIDEDITPQQRERLLALLDRTMQAGRIGVISTAPQLGRHCLSHAAYPGSRTACSHAGSGSGAKARVVARYLGGCGAGRTYACIQPNGDVTPCVYMPHAVMGNVRHAEYPDIWREHPLWETLNDRDAFTHHCGTCRFKFYCGGCRARADAYFGDPAAGDPGCVFNQAHWDRLVAGAEEQEEDATLRC